MFDICLWFFFSWENIYINLVSTYTYICGTPNPIMIQNITIIPESSLRPLLSKSLPSPLGANTVLIFSTIDYFLSFVERHINGNIQYVFWLLLFIMFFEISLFVVFTSRSFLFLSESCSLVWLFYSLFIHVPVDRHPDFSGFWLLWI